MTKLEYQAFLTSLTTLEELAEKLDNDGWVSRQIDGITLSHAAIRMLNFMVNQIRRFTEIIIAEAQARGREA